MKRGTPRHPKVEHLRRLLRCDRATAIGYLELLWHFTAEYAPQGDIGKYEDAWIEASCSYEPRGTRRIGGLVHALIESRWVDVSPSNRLVIHDWIDHCDEYTRRRLERAKLSFVQNQQYTDKVTDKSPPAYAYAMPKPYTHNARATLASDQKQKTPVRWEQFRERYPRKQHMNQAAQAYVSVVTGDNEPQVFACLERYLDSDEVARGVVQNPEKWLFEQAADGWAGKWPAKNGHKSAPPTGPTEAMKLAEQDFQEYQKKFGETA